MSTSKSVSVECELSDVGRKAWVMNSEGDDGRARSSPRAFAAFAGPASASISSRNSYWRRSYASFSESTPRAPYHHAIGCPAAGCLAREARRSTYIHQRAMGLTTPTSNSAWRGGMTIRAAGPEKACKATMLHLRRTTVRTKRAGLVRIRDAPSRRRCRQHALCLREPRLFVALHAAQAAAAVGSRYLRRW